MKFNLSLLLIIFIAFALFVATYLMTNAILSETFGKIRQDELDDIKKIAAKLALIPFFIVFTVFAYCLKAYFDLSNLHFIILSLSASVLFFLAIYFGSQFIDPKNIDRKRKSIEKKESAEGLGTLLNAVQPTQDIGSPLISYVYDDQLETPVWNALRVTNEDRGIVLGLPGSGQTTYLVTQIIDWMRSGQSFVATDIKPEIWAILKYNNIFEQFDALKSTPIAKEAHVKFVQEGMRRVVNEPGGTAYGKRIEAKGFEMAGKTGTSQVISKREKEMSAAENAAASLVLPLPTAP